jgi:hypothetical protein
MLAANGEPAMPPNERLNGGVNGGAKMCQMAA